jgi:hypothetical protein
MDPSAQRHSVNYGFLFSIHIALGSPDTPSVRSLFRRTFGIQQYSSQSANITPPQTTKVQQRPNTAIQNILLGNNLDEKFAPVVGTAVNNVFPDCSSIEAQDVGYGDGYLPLPSIGVARI